MVSLKMSWRTAGGLKKEVQQDMSLLSIEELSVVLYTFLNIEISRAPAAGELFIICDCDSRAQPSAPALKVYKYTPESRTGKTTTHFPP